MSDLATFQKAHEDVKAGFTYVPDDKQYGEIEHWVVPDDPYNVEGDCEDFALAVRKVCDDAGVKTRLVYCIWSEHENSKKQSHIVLAHQGNISDCNLKSVYGRTRLEQETGLFGWYTWVSISRYEPGKQWQKLKTKIKRSPQPDA